MHSHAIKLITFVLLENRKVWWKTNENDGSQYFDIKLSDSTSFMFRGSVGPNARFAL